MKTFFSLLLFVFVAQCVWAQDVIVTVDNKRINAKVIEQNSRFIKYKMLDPNDQSIMQIKSKDVQFIEFETGYVQYLFNQNRRAIRPLGVSTGLSLPLGNGPAIAFASVDYFIVPQFSLETNVGRTFDRSYYAIGAKYHLNSRYSDNKFAPFVGLLLDTEYKKSMVLIPIGFSYISNNGFYASFSFNQFMFFDLKTDTNFEFKFGFRPRR